MEILCYSGGKVMKYLIFIVTLTRTDKSSKETVEYGLSKSDLRQQANIV